MSDRNLNPHAEARVAMIIWSYEYAYEQRGGSMDFWDSRTDGQKQQCAAVVDKILASRRADGTPPQEHVTGSVTDTSKAMLDVSIERHRQVMAEGWAPEHDDRYIDNQLSRAAACYAIGNTAYWPWREFWWKPTSRRRDLVKAAALLIAEIERLDRADKASLDAIAGMTEDQI